ncbi:MAG: ATP-grasp domain-containing protein [Candidatus Obscuribacterales bacterium]|nr:ATP-grasp domain-containing protein [Candidatus Obscuribacterales bacterium]
MERILITGGRAPVSLELVRQFSTAGKKVFVADSAPCFLASGSKLIEKSFQLPRPRQSPREFADALEKIIIDERIDMVIPTCEEVFYLSRFAARLRKITDLFCLDLGQLRPLHNKWTFSVIAKGLGVEVPQTWLIRTLDDLQSISVPPEELVFKPVYSRFAVHTLIKPKSNQLGKINPTEENPWVAQKFIEGNEFCSYAVACNGKLTAHALYEPLWRAGRSSSYYFAATERKSIELFTSNFVKETNYTGQVAFDFIEDKDGKIYVLECNPRATSGMHLFLPQDNLTKAFAPGCENVIHPSAAEPRMLSTIMAILGPAQALQTGRYKQYLKDFARAKDAVWNSKDPYPSLYGLVGLSAFLCLAVKEGLNPMAASTFDIEWDGEEIAPDDSFKFPQLTKITQEAL